MISYVNSICIFLELATILYEHFFVPFYICINLNYVLVEIPREVFKIVQCRQY